MTKFEGPDDLGFVAVCGELRRWTKDINSVKRQPLLGSQSLPLLESDLDERHGAATMHGDNNRQYNAFGSANQKIVNDYYFEAKRDRTSVRSHGSQRGMGSKSVVRTIVQ